MIGIMRRGNYILIETVKQTKILIIDNKETFAWINAHAIGEILVASHKIHQDDSILAAGKYRLYRVEQEKNFTDELHLELCVGEGLWQGYLLPTGLPEGTKKRDKIIPTKELITRTKIHALLPIRG